MAEVSPHPHTASLSYLGAFPHYWDSPVLTGSVSYQGSQTQMEDTSEGTGATCPQPESQAFYTRSSE